MVTGYFTALLALAASVNGLAVPDKRGSEAYPKGVFYQQLTRVSGPTTKQGLASRNFARDDNPLTDPDIRGNGTDTYESIFSFGAYLVSISLYDGNGNSLGNSLASIDTGSSDLWALTPIPATETTLFFGSLNPAADTTGSTKLVYGDRNFTIHYADTTEVVLQYYTGTIGVSNTTDPLKNFQFGSALFSNASGGYLGIGFTENEQTAYYKDYVGTYANYPVALKEQGFINKVAFSLYFGNGFDRTPVSQPDAHILWGGVDHGLYTGELVTFPNQRPDYPAIHLETITTGDGVVYTINNSSIIDTGTTTAFLPRAIVNSIDEAFGIQGGQPTKFPLDETLTLDFGTIQLEVPYSNFYQNDPGMSSYYPFFVSEEHEGLVVLGDTILRSAYVVLDYEANTTSIAKANTNVTYSDITVFQ